jgi:hypothetical protein
MRIFSTQPWATENFPPDLQAAMLQRLEPTSDERDRGSSPVLEIGRLATQVPDATYLLLAYNFAAMEPSDATVFGARYLAERIRRIETGNLARVMPGGFTRTNAPPASEPALLELLDQGVPRGPGERLVVTPDTIVPFIELRQPTATIGCYDRPGNLRYEMPLDLPEPPA